MNWLDKLKEYAPSIASAVLTGGATLPQLALKAIADATGEVVTNETEMAAAINGASPETMLKVKQADNSFKIRMTELANELTATELGDVQHAREQHAHSIMPTLICGFLTVTVVAFGAALMFVLIPPGNVRILDTLFGTFLTAWLGSMAYWNGTTRSSAQKTAMIKGR
jgi:hypothetical protein